MKAWEPPSLGDSLKVALASGSISALMPPKEGVIVDCLKARGVTKGEMAKLKSAGIIELIVKESLPFAPVLALGFAAAVIIARWLTV